jgi:hypothetical protein
MRRRYAVARRGDRAGVLIPATFQQALSREHPGSAGSRKKHRSCRLSQQPQAALIRLRLGSEPFDLSREAF